jgi:hypothetical protein
MRIVSSSSEVASTLECHIMHTSDLVETQQAMTAFKEADQLKKAIAKP